MTKSISICLAIGDEEINAALAEHLRAIGHNPWPAYNAASALSRLGQGLFDALMVGALCHQIDGVSFLPFVRRVYPRTRIVAVLHAAAPHWQPENLKSVDASIPWPANAETLQQALGRTGERIAPKSLQKVGDKARPALCFLGVPASS